MVVSSNYRCSYDTSLLSLDQMGDTSVFSELNPLNPDGSFSRQAVSVTDTMGAGLGWIWGKFSGNQFLVDAAKEQMLDSYNGSAFGQTENAEGWAYYGTRGAYGVAVAGTAAAVVVGSAEAIFIGNNPILVEGVLGGGKMSSGGLLQLRPQGYAPLIRLDYHAFSAGTTKLPHLDSGIFNIHHWPW